MAWQRKTVVAVTHGINDNDGVDVEIYPYDRVDAAGSTSDELFASWQPQPGELDDRAAVARRIHSLRTDPAQSWDADSRLPEAFLTRVQPHDLRVARAAAAGRYSYIHSGDYADEIGESLIFDVDMDTDTMDIDWQSASFQEAYGPSFEAASGSSAYPAASSGYRASVSNSMERQHGHILATVGRDSHGNERLKCFLMSDASKHGLLLEGSTFDDGTLMTPQIAELIGSTAGVNTDSLLDRHNQRFGDMYLLNGDYSNMASDMSVQVDADSLSSVGSIRSDSLISMHYASDGRAYPKLASVAFASPVHQVVDESMTLGRDVSQPGASAASAAFGSSPYTAGAYPPAASSYPPPAGSYPSPTPGAPPSAAGPYSPSAGGYPPPGGSYPPPAPGTSASAAVAAGISERRFGSLSPFLGATVGRAVSSFLEKKGHGEVVQSYNQASAAVPAGTASRERARAGLKAAFSSGARSYVPVLADAAKAKLRDPAVQAKLKNAAMTGIEMGLASQAPKVAAAATVAQSAARMSGMTAAVAPQAAPAAPQTAAASPAPSMGARRVQQPPGAALTASSLASSMKSASTSVSKPAAKNASANLFGQLAPEPRKRNDDHGLSR